MFTAVPIVDEEDQKPVSEAREMFEPSRAPGTRTAPKRPGPVVPPKAPKKSAPLQQSQEESQRYMDRVSMEIVDRQPIPEYKRRVPLPVEEPKMKPEKKPMTKKAMEPKVEPEKKVTTKKEMSFPKFGVPVEETAPTKQTLYLKEKPRFTRVSD